MEVQQEDDDQAINITRENKQHKLQFSINKLDEGGKFKLIFHLVSYVYFV